MAKKSAPNNQKRQKTKLQLGTITARQKILVLVNGYKAMAADIDREREASHWIEGLFVFSD